MKALLAEYTVFNDSHLAPEGEAMLRALGDSFERCGYEVVTPQGHGADFEEELKKLAPECDVGLVIAPDALLARYTKIVEDLTHNIGCGSLNVAICANKQRCGNLLESRGIAVPKEVSSGHKVIKQISGCATENMRLSEEMPGPGEFGQEYIEGDNISVSLIGGRVVGDTCLYYSGKPPLVLSMNRQFIEIEDGLFRYMGGETPVDHPRGDEIKAVAVEVVNTLGCQGYTGVDMIVADKIYVVDVNPRPTSSMVAIVEIMEEEIADLLVNASRGELLECVHLNGHATFDRESRVVLS